MKGNIISSKGKDEMRMFMNKEIRGEKRREIFEIIKKAKRISLKEIKASTNINYNTIRSEVIELTKAGLIDGVDRCIHKLK
ncbi:MAG: hypothetical protein QW292_04670 [Candidatus Parvarchaeota archaeon]